MTVDDVMSAADALARKEAERHIPTGDLYRNITHDAWVRARVSMRAVIEQYAREMRQAERARCAAAVGSVSDRSGVNDDGEAWLMRATRGDFIAAIYALADQPNEAA